MGRSRPAHNPWGESYFEVVVVVVVVAAGAGGATFTSVTTSRSCCQLPGGDVETQPRSMIEPGWVVATTIVTVAVAPGASEPRLQAIVWLPVQVPWLGVAETSVVLPGIRSWKPAVAAVPEPWLPIVAV